MSKYFTDSALVNGQGIFTENMQSGEWRQPDNAALMTIRQTEVLNPQIATLKTAEGRTIYGYMPTRAAAGSGTTISHNFTGNKGDSAATAISYSCITEEFSISKKQANNNILTWSTMYASTLRDRFYSLINRLDAAFVALLKADRSGYCAGGGRGTFDDDNDVYEIPYSEKDYPLANTREMMNFNLYPGNLMAICDSKMATDLGKLAPQGSANSVNYGYQFSGWEYRATTRTIMGTEWDGSALVFQPNLIALFPWIPPQNRQPLNATMAMSSSILTYGQITVPGLPFTIGITAYSANVNDSSAGGGKQDVRTYFQIFLFCGYLSAPLSSLNSESEKVVFAIGKNYDIG